MTALYAPSFPPNSRNYKSYFSVKSQKQILPERSLYNEENFIFTALLSLVLFQEVRRHWARRYRWQVVMWMFPMRQEMLQTLHMTPQSLIFVFSTSICFFLLNPMYYAQNRLRESCSYRVICLPLKKLLVWHRGINKDAFYDLASYLIYLICAVLCCSVLSNSHGL